VVSADKPARRKDRRIIVENMRRVLLKEYLMRETRRAGFGGLDIQRTPMGTRVTLLAERPGLVIGRKGAAIKGLTEAVERQFKFDNPQIEVQEVEQPSLNAQIMAEKLSNALERGWHFRRAGHSTVRRIMEAGAKGCLVVIAGKLTGQRHRTEKFKAGHIKYCGEPRNLWMDRGFAVAKLKPGVIGVTVEIMDPKAKLPDDIEISKLPDVAPAPEVLSIETEVPVTSIEPEPLGPEPSVAETRETPEADEVVLEEPEARENPRAEGKGRGTEDQEGPQGSEGARGRGGDRRERGGEVGAPPADEGDPGDGPRGPREEARGASGRAHARARRGGDGRRAPQPGKDPRPSDEHRAHPDDHGGGGASRRPVGAERRGEGGRGLMAAICSTCGLPDELCMCEEIAKEQQQIRVYNDTRRYGKVVTIVDGLDSSDIDLEELARTLKNKCAAGGTAKKGRIELQGEHKRKVQGVLEGMGYAVEVR